MNKNYYEILGIEPSASPTEIKKAYKKLAQKFHPDKNDGDYFFEKMFKNIQEAYDCLSNPDCRRKYDQKINSFSKKNDSTPKEKSTPTYNERKSTEDHNPREKSSSSNTWGIAFGLIFVIFLVFIAFQNSPSNKKNTTVEYPIENEFNSVTNKKQPIAEKENLSRVIDSMKYIQEDQIRKANRKIDSIKRIQAEKQEQISLQERIPESKADLEKSEVIFFLEEYYKFYKRDDVFRRPMVKKIDQYNYEVSIEECNRRFEDSDFHYRAIIVYISREDDGSLKYGKRYHSDMFN